MDGTLCAVRDWDTDDAPGRRPTNKYSDGRQVMVQIRSEPGDSPGLQLEAQRSPAG